VPGTFPDAIHAITQRFSTTADAAPDGFPFSADPATGEWTTLADAFWTGGYWAGLLWLSADDRAEHWSRRLDERLDVNTGLRGMLFWYGAALGDQLAGCAEAGERALIAARRLRAAYDERTRVIPLGRAMTGAPEPTDLVVNIDTVAGTPALLGWAARRTGEEDFAAVASVDAERRVEICLRDDGSTVQAGTLDASTGAVVRRHTQKGLSDTSTWSRGQAWAMLGFSQAAVWLSEVFLEPAERAADWWLRSVPASRVAPWDFGDPEGLRDTSATAIAAAALTKLAVLLPHRHKEFSFAAQQTLRALVDHHLTSRGNLVDGCYDHAAGWAIADELIWGSYFLFEALAAIDGRLDPLAV
jgi:unsaturated chondroitin disaccharide hydrolase